MGGGVEFTGGGRSDGRGGWAGGITTLSGRSENGGNVGSLPDGVPAGAIAAEVGDDADEAGSSSPRAARRHRKSISTRRQVDLARSLAPATTHSPAEELLTKMGK